MNAKHFIILFCLVFSCSNIFASQDSIEHKIARIEKSSKIKIGLSAIHMETGRFINYKQDEKFPMASSAKLPIAIYALHLVERSKISMRQMVDLAPYDACLGTGMLGRYYLNYPGLSISVANLLEPMMLISDNSASDAILKIIGGPRKLYQYLKQNGFDDIHVDRSFMEIYEVTTGLDILPPKSTYTLKKWQKWKETGDHNVKNRQYREFYEDEKDTTTPRAMNHLVLNLYNNVLLNKTNTDFLIDIMKRTWDGHRINRFLPPNVKIAHKTGTWYDNDVPEAHYGYLNDVGIIYLPDNKGHIAISIYSSSDKIKDIKSYAIALGKVSKLVYDELSS